MSAIQATATTHVAPNAADVLNATDARMKALVIAAFLLFGLAITPMGASAQATASGPTVSSLNPGDVLRITVWRKPELSGDFVIASDGTVSHPLYREIRVTGIPLDAVESRIREYLTKLEANPQFVIEPQLRVAVSGEVRQPNLYALRPETSLAQAVAMAGGPNERGRHDRIRLIRQNRELIVDLRRPDESGAGMRVLSGDQLVVEPQRAFFRDVLSPTVNVLGATAAVIGVILYNRNR